MARFDEHCRDCERLLGNPFGDVHKWMDAYMKTLGPMHRFMRHHARGIGEAGGEFGALGMQAAAIHVLKDCGHIPTERDWKEQKVDTLGMDPKGRFNGYWDPWQFDAAAKKLIGA